MSYYNPDEELQKRPILEKGSTQYQLMMVRIHEDGNCSNSRIYDATCHSLETRASRKDHERKCVLMTPKYYAGDTIEETEKKFIQKVTLYGFAENDRVKAVLFRDLVSINQKTNPKTQSELQVSQPNLNMTQWQGMNQLNPFSMVSNFSQPPYFPCTYSYPMPMSQQNVSAITSNLPSPSSETISEEKFQKEFINRYEEKIHQLEASNAQIQNQLTGILALLTKQTKKGGKKVIRL